jgi:ribosomal RNA-processing protein 9
MLKSVPDFGIAGHWADVLSVAVTADGAIVASGGRDKTVRIWDGKRLRSRETFVGHKDAVTALSFLRGPARTLFSAGLDRLVKVWSCDEMALVETLFGHQAEISSLDTPLGGAAGARERVVTAGADATARLWKIPEQTQLVFRPGGAPPRIEAVRAVSEGVFVTGDAEGALALWSVTKKRPLAVIVRAHGSGVSVPRGDAGGEPAPPAPSGDITFSLALPGSVQTLAKDADGGGVPAALLDEIAQATGARADALSAGYCHGITALAVMPHADVFATGSGDGFVRIWSLVAGGAGAGAAAFRGIKYIGAVRVRGIVNGLAFSDDGSTLCAAVGSEHRLGRWWSYADATDGIAVIRLATT